MGNITIDDTLSKGNLFDLANEFRGLSPSHLITETLPTTSYVTDGGADVLLEAQPYADNMINAFNQLGVSPGSSPTTTTTTAPTVAASQVPVQVLNASTVGGIAHLTASALTSAGFDVTEVGNAPTPITAGDPSQIWYGPTGLAAAHALGAVLSGPVSYVPVTTLSGNALELLIAGSALTVKSSATTTTSTSTTVPSTGSGSTTTTIPSDVYTNTQPEPWNSGPVHADQFDPGHHHGDGQDQAWASVPRSRRAVRSGGLAALAHDAPALPLRRASPDTLALAVGQGMLEARLTDRAYRANSLGLGRIGLVLGHRVEGLNIEAPAGGLLAPRGGDHGEHFLTYRRI